MPRQQRAVATRSSILRAAAAVIDRHGYEAATVAEIVRAAGITKGALYFHFPSKEALAEAVIAEQDEWRTQRGPGAGPPVQAVVDLTYSFVEALLTDPLMRASVRMTLDRAAGDDVIRAGYLGWIEAVADMLREAEAAGSLVPGTDPDRFAYVVTSVVTGMQLTSEALTGRADLPQRVEDFWRLVLPVLVRAELLDTVDPRPPASRAGGAAGRSSPRSRTPARPS
ncbi:ScbR family autoregulator-binding transcription factor [Arthrobacter sp. NEB 688]|uniref:ScbR family autoregulator-binding transcription factor n=1 Tax=Arthrobacter sp. NEB 688 TaxID=904039 RepID=UPI001C20B0CC|nr:ScbR family autoregulator-binding transcription factor [Arthrobacter sp. NEB 688]